MSDSGIIELSIASHPKNLAVVRGATERLARLEGFSDEASYCLMLAIDEALANVIEHGYDGRPDQPITVTLQPVKSPDGRGGIAVSVRDMGRQVDPATIKGRDLDEVRPGGLGVHIIQQMMDEYDYSCPADGGMLLRMVKYVAKQPSAVKSE